MSAVPSAQAPNAQKTELPPEAYRQAVDQADLAISITDPKANILFANEAFARVTGYTPDEIIGQNESVLSNQFIPARTDLWLIGSRHVVESCCVRRAWRQIVFWII